MTVVSEATIPGHLDFLVMQPDEERAIVRDLMFAVLAFNTQSRGEALQISFPLFTDLKVTGRNVLGPCVRITGPAQKLYVLTLRHEVSSHLRSGRAMTMVRDQSVIDTRRHERFDLISAPAAIREARPIVLSGQSRLTEAAGRLGVVVADEAVFVARAETKQVMSGTIDLLGFSDSKTVPVLA